MKCICQYYSIVSLDFLIQSLKNKLNSFETSYSIFFIYQIDVLSRLKKMYQIFLLDICDLKFARQKSIEFSQYYLILNR